MYEWRRDRRKPGDLIAKGPGARRFFRIGQVQSLAVLATVNLSVLPVFLFHLVAEEIPALQVAGAEFSLGVFFAASAHPRIRRPRRFTLVPSLSVPTSSATGMAWSETGYFGFGISEGRVYQVACFPGAPRYNRADR